MQKLRLPPAEKPKPQQWSAQQNEALRRAMQANQGKKKSGAGCSSCGNR